MNFIALAEMIRRAFLFSLLPTALAFSYYCYRVKASKRAKITTFFAIYYLVTLVYVTLYRNGIHIFQEIRYPINYIPLFSLFAIIADAGMLVFFYNVIGNLAWFVPLGLLIPQYCRDVTWRKVISYSCFVSLSIEVLQFLLQAGTTDIDDVILNTLGGMIGYACYKRFHIMVLKRQDR